MGELYRLDFPNGKSYIGISFSTAQARFKGHRHAASSGKIKTPLYSTWKKYGEPTLIVLARIPNEKLAKAEIRAIKKLNTIHPFGCNLHRGGTTSPMTIPEVVARRTGWRHSEEAKKKISDAQKRRSPESIERSAAGNRGKKVSPEARKKMSLAAKGKPKSESHRINLTIARRKRELER